VTPLQKIDENCVPFSERVPGMSGPVMSDTGVTFISGCQKEIDSSSSQDWRLFAMTASL